jgi:hypothetical protein
VSEPILILNMIGSGRDQYNWLLVLGAGAGGERRRARQEWHTYLPLGDAVESRAKRTDPNLNELFIALELCCTVTYC